MKDEGNILRELDHPNIVKVYDVFDEEEIFAIVMEYASHGDLFNLVALRSTQGRRLALVHTFLGISKSIQVFGKPNFATVFHTKVWTSPTV